MFSVTLANHRMRASWAGTVSLPATVSCRPIRRVCPPISASARSYGSVVSSHIAAVLTASLLINSIATPLLLPTPAKAATAAVAQTASATLQVQNQTNNNAPDVHAEAPDTHSEQQWWQRDADAWIELTSPSELSAFLNSSQSTPAWPYLTDENLSKKLRVVEFYATWCPACRAAAAGMAAVAKDPQLQPTCSFARANADRVKPLMKQLGISKIPTAIIISPDGQILDTVRASGQVVRDAVLMHAAALSQATAGRVPLPPAAATPPEDVPPPSPEELAPSELDETTVAAPEGPAAASSSSPGVSCGLTPEPSCGQLPSGIVAPSSSSSSTVPASGAAAAAARADTPLDPAAAAAGLAAAKQEFLQQYGDQYGYNGWLDQHYEAEVGRRLGEGHHYLDYTGAALYPASLLQAVYSDLLTHTYGNPHSLTAAGGPAAAGAAAAARVAPAAASEAVLEEAALALLQHLNADPAQYQVVFTRSATEALKLVGEMFPWTPATTDGGRSSSSNKAPVTSEVQMLQPLVSPQQSQQRELDNAAAVHATAGSSSSSSSSSQFIYTRSNHNSVLGIGAYASAAGAQLVPMTDMEMDSWLSHQQQQQQQRQSQQSGPIDEQQSAAGNLRQLFSRAFQNDKQQQQQQQQQQEQLQPADTTTMQDSSIGASNGNTVNHSSSSSTRYHLVAYPAEDNFAGVVYPLEWINQAHAASSPSDRYYVLVDAAAYLPTHPLDLTAHPADFVVASFYKMFGYPTGLGALVLRTDLVPQLHKVYFGGGSVSLATPEGCWHVSKCDPGQALTDGTPNFLGAAALKLAFENWDSRGGVQAVQQHTRALTSWLHQHLTSLQHSNGAPLLKIFGNYPQPTPKQQPSISTPNSRQQHQHLPSTFGQGSILNLQVLKPDGTPLSYLQVEKDAAAAGLDLRSGCVCNPGACYDSLGLYADEVQGLAGLKEGCGDDLDVITVMRPAGLGYNARDNRGGSLGGWNVSQGSEPGQADSDVAREQQDRQLLATQIPLGSVRASLGWASTFEDAYALVRFLKTYIV